ncbi:MAG: PSD1 and planctomycete cytochrome C domain-containing protein [Planctomycetia bacterium]|nr:PSD1 and planctomycete cytochrome C domain-containing protein [Planctomycetia bacterium]
MRLKGRLLILGLLLPCAALAAAADEPDFERDIAPLLVQHCIDCHQINKRSGGLDLTTIEGQLRGGDSGAAVVRGKPAESLLIERIAAGEMPPTEAKDARRLTAPEAERLRSWIASGARWPKDRDLGVHEKTVDLDQARDFWSFRKVVRLPLPVGPATARTANPIDAFISARLSAVGLALSERAPLSDQLRRASLDVRGLPPTIEEQHRFLADSAPEAYERLIDRMLADSAYGERWARHWLDLVRYADSNGYERDAPKPSVYQYRDYVIRSLNADKPYDRFVVEQLAGDELPEVTFETLAATGFHALGTWQDEVDPLEAPQYRADELDDMIRTVSQTFLGITLGCARCHQHKFDPFTMVDYYSLAAILAPLRRPSQGRNDRDLPVGTAEQIEAQKDRDRADAELEKRIRALLEEQKKKPSSDSDAPLAELRDQQRLLRVKQPDLPRVYRLFEDSAVAPATYLLKSGRASNPGPVMQPRVPAVLANAQPVFPAGGTRSTLRRLTLAKWLADPDHPLTARVMVNRVWQHHFGVGLVATSSDFGHMGARPTHPELLDWLAHWFTHDAGWSLKKLHRLILTSDTYRQSSQRKATSVEIDPENKRLWRYPYRRLDAEAIRDSALAVSGELNRKPFGPAVYLPLPEAVIEAHTDKQSAWQKSPPEEVKRRTIYTFVKRTLMVPMLETFDFCDTTQSSERRSITNVATQALTLYNGTFVNEQAEYFARRLEREAGADTAARIDWPIAWRWFARRASRN